jgi:hypothetical protein
MKIILFSILFFQFFYFNKIEIELVHKFKKIEVEFPSPDIELNFKNYSENMVIAGIKFDPNNNMIVSIPRWKPNIPITLAIYNNITNKFSPFPNWQWNDLSNNDAKNTFQVINY